MSQAQRSEFKQLLADIREPGGLRISAERFAAKLDMPLSRLAQLTGVEPETPDDLSDSPEVQLYLEAAVKVLEAAMQLAGGDCGRAIHWFRNDRIQPLGYRTPEVLVSEGCAEKLLRYIDTLYAGTG